MKKCEIFKLQRAFFTPAVSYTHLEGESIMISPYPKFNSALVFEADEAEMNRIISCIRAVRNRRAEMNVAPSKKASLYIVTDEKSTFETGREFFIKLASSSDVNIVDCYNGDDAVQIVTESATLYIPLAEMIDFEKELERLSADKKKTIGEIERIERKLSNEGFVSKAPAAVVDGERKKLDGYKDTLENINKAIERISK